MMGDFFLCAVILAKHVLGSSKWRESSVVVRAQHNNDASRWLAHWIPAVARMTAVDGGGAK